MKVRRTKKCFIDKTKIDKGFSTGVVFIADDSTMRLNRDDYHEGVLTYTEEVPVYSVEKFIEGIGISGTVDNDIREIKVSEGFYEELEDHARNSGNFPLQEKNTLNIFGTLITKEN